MGEFTSISWTDQSFAPWFGCTKVGPACDGCYAEHLTATRFGKAQWGPHADRVRSAASTWKQPLAWNRKAERDGTRPFVFCSHLSDVFDNQVPVDWRRDLFDLIRATPNLTWLLLTKRPQNIVRLFKETMRREDGLMLARQADRPDAWWPRNAAVGATMVTQAEFDRDGGHLAIAKAALKPAFTFASVEPMLGAIDMGPEISWLDWVITGGETDQGAHKARLSHPDWFRSLRDQCAAAGVAYHHKQNGEWLGRPEMIDASGPSAHRFDDGLWMDKVGVGRSGRELDRVVHDARPQSINTTNGAA